MILLGCRVFGQQDIEFNEKFEHFWNNTLLELDTIPLKYEQVLEKIFEEKKIELIRITSFNNIYFYLAVSTNY